MVRLGFKPRCVSVTWVPNLTDLHTFCQTQSICVVFDLSFYGQVNFKLSLLMTHSKTGSSRMVFDFQAHVTWEFYLSLLTQSLYLVIWQLLPFGFLELLVQNNVFYWRGDIAHPFLKALVLSPDSRLAAFYFSLCSRIAITLPPHILSMLSLNMGSDVHGEF